MSLPAARAEEIRAALLELVPEGFEEREHGRELELVAYVAAEREAVLRGAFTHVTAEDVDEGYADAWRVFHRPVRVGSLWIGPPWEQPRPDGAIVIDPARAFGTGAHPTTRLCLEFLLDLEPSSVVDLGCGSGVLAIAAARLGFAPVVAIDNEEAAVAATRANAAVNLVEIDVRLADVLHERIPAAHLALANLERYSLELAAPRVRSSMLLVSGILESERPQLGGRWARRERRELEGWAAELHEALGEPD